MNIVPFDINGITISNNLFLAPMAGITDLPFRLLCKEFGCGMVYSEMVSAKSILYENKNTIELLATDPAEIPIAVQLFGSEPEDIAAAAEKIEHLPFAIVDINMGCPATKIVKNGEGSALMKDPDRINRIITTVVKRSKKPVTIKIRSGFDKNNINAVAIAKIAEAAGVAAVTVHGRTREQQFGGTADLGIIAQVKQSVQIPVIGNGDITDHFSAMRMFEETGCDAIMIGRGALGRPWIFQEVTDPHHANEMTVEARVNLAVRHGEMLIQSKGEYIGVREMRKHLSWYSKGLPNASKTRTEINQAESFAEIKRILYTNLLGSG